VKVLRELGIHDAVAAAPPSLSNGTTAMRELARSTAAGLVGCTQITEIRYTPGVVLAGALPVGFELSTVLHGSQCAAARRSPG
jgi:molybdate transport system substrate-binding protein